MITSTRKPMSPAIIHPGTVPTGPAVWSIVAMVPGSHDGFVAVAEPPHGTVSRELLPLAVSLNVPVPTAPISQVRVIVTPPDVAAAACAGLIAIAAAMTENSPKHDACIAPLAKSRRPFSTHLVIGFGLRTLRVQGRMPGSADGHRHTGDAVESSRQPLTVTVALPWRTARSAMPTNCQRRSYRPGCVPEGTGICMAKRTDWAGAIVPTGRQLRRCGSLAK